MKDTGGSKLKNNLILVSLNFLLKTKLKKKRLNERKPIVDDTKQFDKLLALGSAKSGTLNACNHYMRLIKYLRREKKPQTEQMIENSFKSGGGGGNAKKM